MKPKLIGLLTAWGAKDWIKPAIRQAKEYCDEVLVFVGAYTEPLKQFEDDTYKIVSEFQDIKLFTEANLTSYSESRAEVFNMMLNHSEYYRPGNWLWILDVDEFYPETSYKKIKEIISEDNYNTITVEEKFFLINMWHYLHSSHRRLFRIGVENMVPWDRLRFRPTQKWFQFNRKEFTLPRERGMFHYSLLTNPNMREVQWRTEYPDTEQAHKVKWLTKIYKNYDLSDEDLWLKRNKEISGIYSPWMAEGMKPKDDGKLFRYNGEQPKYIRETDLPEVEDFRERYDF